MTRRRVSSSLLPWIAAGVAGGALVGAVAMITAAFVGPPQGPHPSRTAASPATAPAQAAAAKAPAPIAPAPHADSYPIKRALTIDHQLSHGEWIWDEKGVGPGALLVTVDLKAQMMSVFRDGYEIGVAVIEHGASDKPTPLGAFPILGKDADHVSSRYDGPDGRPAPMPWALRLTNDGVFIHGAAVRPDWASNGCVGIPNDFAKRLFAVARPGDLVIITSGKVMKVGDPLPAIDGAAT